MSDRQIFKKNLIFDFTRIFEAMTDNPNNSFLPCTTYLNLESGETLCCPNCVEQVELCGGTEGVNTYHKIRAILAEKTENWLQIPQLDQNLIVAGDIDTAVMQQFTAFCHDLGIHPLFRD